MRISLGSWAFSFGPYADNPIPFEKVVRRIAEVGYDGVEICGFDPHISLDSYPNHDSRAPVRRLLTDLNLGVSGYSADFTTINPVVAGNKQRYLDLFERNLELCVDIGAPLIRIDSVSAPGSIDEADRATAVDRLADTWHEAAGISEKAAVRVLWEFEPGFEFNKPSEVIELHDKVGHPNFQILFDTSHAYTSGVIGARQQGKKETVKGGVVALLKKLEGRIGHIHIIDSDGSLYGGETSTHRPFGQGKIDFDLLGPKLLELPGIEWWCVDHSFWAGSWDLIEPSLRFVRRLTGGGAPR